MTDLLTRDPNDTGEIPNLGDDPTRNLAEYARNTPSFHALPNGDLTAELPAYTPGAAIGFDGPQAPPTPLSPIPDEAPTERVTLLGGQPETRLRRAAPGRAAFKTRHVFARGRHARPAPAWAWLTATLGIGVALGAIALGAVLAVIR